MLQSQAPCCSYRCSSESLQPVSTCSRRVRPSRLSSISTSAATAAASTADRTGQLCCPFITSLGWQQRNHSYSIPSEFQISRRCSCRATAAAAAATSEAESQSHAAVQQLVAARGLDLDPGLVAQEAHLAFSYLSTQPVALPQQLQDAAQLAEHALHLTDLMATGSTFMTLQMLKRHPALLQLTPYQVANRVLQLKLLMPAADVARLLYQKPTLLLIDDLPGVVGAALNKLHALMPGIPVESKLHEGGTVFWSFSSLIQDTSSSKAAARAHIGPAAAAAAAAAPGPELAAMATSVAEFHETMMAQQQQQRSLACPSPDAHMQQQEF